MFSLNLCFKLNLKQIFLVALFSQVNQVYSRLPQSHFPAQTFLQKTIPREVSYLEWTFFGSDVYLKATFPFRKTFRLRKCIVMSA